ncbi:MAG: hypothetical protein E4H08_09350, partial [Candidatus Atribacteria bacterium]
MLKRLVTIMTFLLLLTICIACTQAPPASLDTLMANYFAAKGTFSGDKAIQALTYSGAAAEEIASRLRAGREYPADMARGWSVHMIESIDGATRPFHVYIPETYDATQPHAVIVYLHGLVSVVHTVEDLIP